MEEYYVGFLAEGINSEGDKDDLLVVFDFETEEDYVDFVEEGYPDIDEHIVESFELNYEDWVYTGNWSEHEIFGDETEFEGEIISV